MELMFNFRPNKKKIVILGGGFGGLYTAIILKKLSSIPLVNLDITLIDRKEKFIFYPFLYEMLSEELSEKDISIDYRTNKELKGIKILQSEIKSINLFERVIETDNKSVQYDILVISLGSKIRVSSTIQGKPNVFLFKTLLDVEKFKHQIIYQFKRFLSLKDSINSKKTNTTNNKKKKTETISKIERELHSYLTFLVVGGGPSGVELSAKLSDILSSKCIENGIDPNYGKIILIDINDRLLPTLHQSISFSVTKILEKKGIEIHLGVSLQKLEDDNAIIIGKDEKYTIPCSTIIWTGGTEFNPVISNSGLDTTAEGKILIDEYLQSLHSMGVFAIGDNAIIEKNKALIPLPATAQVAIQEAYVCSYNIIAHILSLPKIPFNYIEVGEMVSLGLDSGCVNILGMHFEGKVAKWIRNVLYAINYPSMDSILKITPKILNKIAKNDIFHIK